MKKHLLLLSISILAAAQIAAAQTYYISTVAGNGTASYAGDGGPAIQAELYNPLQTVSDRQGNLYIADDLNQRVRKVDANGIITTFAGTGATGNTGDGGLATLAKLNTPSSLAIDDTGNIYICCYMSSVIRKVNTQGIISTVAGNGSIGFSGDNAAATGAQLGLPRGVAVDHNGNIYIADFGNSCIRKVNKQGIITTFAGAGYSPGYSGNGGQAALARLNQCIQVAIDDTGNLYIADYGNNVIRRVDTSGIISTIAGTGTPGYTGDNGPATSAELQNPTGIAIDRSGNIYLTNAAAQSIRKITKGIINTIGGTGIAGHAGDCGQALLAELRGPVSVSVDTLGNVYVAEYTANSDIRKLTPNGVHGVAFNYTATVPTPVSVCQGQPVTLTASGGNSYLWTNTTDSTSSITINPPKDTTYELAVTAGNCTLDTTIAVAINPSPVLSVTPRSGSYCVSSGINLKASGGSTYTWSPSTDLSATTGSSVIANPSSKTIYTVTATSSAGCTAQTTDTITIKLAPTVSFAYSVSGDTVTFNSDSATGGVTGYSWDFGDSSTAATTESSSHIFNSRHVFYVCLTVYNNSNCSYTRCQNVDLTKTGIQNIIAQPDFSLYPNPVSDKLLVSYSLLVNSIEITNVLGQTLITQTPLPDAKQTTIDVSALPAGVYLLTAHGLNYGNGITVKKFVKE